MPFDAISRRGFLGSSAALAALPQVTSANEKIERAKQAALDILKPSAADLDRGLKLHAESIVFDGYGFARRSTAMRSARR